MVVVFALPQPEISLQPDTLFAVGNSANALTSGAHQSHGTELTNMDYDVAGKFGYDDICNPMPGWKISFNPSSDPGCRCPDQGTKPSRPSAGHLLIAGEATLYGAVSATSTFLEEALRLNPQQAFSRWNSNFQADSTAAAASLTPVGAYVLRTHVFRSA